MSELQARIIGGIGRTLVFAGVIVLLFAGFQLWGTNLHERQAQNELAGEFEDLLESDLATQLEAALAEAETADPDVLPDGTIADPTLDADDPVIDAADPAVDPGLAETRTVAVDLAPELADALRPADGDPFARIEIPAIGVDKTMIEGVRRDDLRAGPGHYPETPFPGQAGNSAIAGHRTTYGAPFHDLHLLEPGDEIDVTTIQGTFTYEVMAHEAPDGGTLGHFIVTPQDTWVLNDQGDNRLTLTACHPLRSARQRIIVTAQLVTQPAVTIELPDPDPVDVELAAGEDLEGALDEVGCVDCAPGDNELAADHFDDGQNTMGDDESALEASLGWQRSELRPTIAWGALALAVVGLALLIGHRWRKWPTYVGATPVFFTLLFFCFTHLDRLIPAF